MFTSETFRKSFFQNIFRQLRVLPTKSRTHCSKKNRLSYTQIKKHEKAWTLLLECGRLSFFWQNSKVKVYSRMEVNVDACQFFQRTLDAPIIGYTRFQGFSPLIRAVKKFQPRHLYFSQPFYLSSKYFFISLYRTYLLYLFSLLYLIQTIIKTPWSETAIGWRNSPNGLKSFFLGTIYSGCSFHWR